MWNLFAVLAVFGHIAFCVWVINRLHATALPYWFLKCLDASWYGFLIGLPIAVFSWLLVRPESGFVSWNHIHLWAITYGTFCGSLAVFTLLEWTTYLRQFSPNPRLITNHTEVRDIAAILGTRPTGTRFSRLVASVPRNEVFQLHVHRKTICLPRLPLALRGVTLTHLSDFHFTGQLTEAFFQAVVDQANRLDSDIVAITGDIIDKPKCLAWLPRVLGRLQSRHGVYFVLGNHDLRIRDEAAVRRILTDCGLIDLGGHSRLVTIHGHSVFLAGNECPWFRKVTDMRECPAVVDGHAPFRILLSHSPDQIAWAKSNEFDLMLAGHTHGGQIRLPVIGPIFAPSRFGVRYAAGTFFESPTLMHVSRGVSGTRLLRWNCPPELAQLILTTDQGVS
jgi:hypothetical protein